MKANTTPSTARRASPGYRPFPLAWLAGNHGTRVVSTTDSGRSYRSIAARALFGYMEYGRR